MNEELLKALQLIKEECKKNRNCKHCPLIDARGNCGVRHEVPENWNLEKREVYF